MSLHLSKDAEQDIADIYVYSFEQFGEAQAESYYQALEEHFDSLARNPALGRDFSFVKTNVRRTNCVSHALYYRVTGWCCGCFTKAVTQRGICRVLL